MAQGLTQEVLGERDAKVEKFLETREMLVAQMDEQWAEAEAGAHDRNPARMIIALRAIEDLRWLQMDVNLRLHALGIKPGGE